MSGKVLACINKTTKDRRALKVSMTGAGFFFFFFEKKGKPSVAHLSAYYQCFDTPLVFLNQCIGLCCKTILVLI